MIRQSYKFYLPDIIELNKHTEFSKKLNEMNPTRIYFWYNEGELSSKEVKQFTDEWQELEHSNFSTKIIPYFFDNSNDFVTWDFIPYKLLDLYKGKMMSYWRYQWRYTKRSDIFKGLKEAKSIWDFINREQLPTKKQKRNDGEDSDYRE